MIKAVDEVGSCPCEKKEEGIQRAGILEYVYPEVGEL